jgi:pimeloyl-ACP methyl ester carboxylesterase
MTTFVLVHGAWHGGWCWSRVASILRERGHSVTTPTQTGVGEKSHLLSRDITLTTFGEDIVNHLKFEELDDVVLVGHSFGGASISYAADKMTDRVQRLVYLDAAVIEAGETPLSNKPADVAALRRQLADDNDGGLSLPPPPAVVMGITDPDDADWIERMMTPHPFNTMETPLEISGLPGAGLSVEYIACTDPWYSPLANDRERAKGYGWGMREIAAGHDCMVSAPKALADLLETPL